MFQKNDCEYTKIGRGATSSRLGGTAPPGPPERRQCYTAYDQYKIIEVKAKPAIITSQPPKTNNGDRKWIQHNLRKRNAVKRSKLPGLSHLVWNLKVFRSLDQNLKFLSENCNPFGVLNNLMQHKCISNGGRRQAIFVILRKKIAFSTPFGSHFTRFRSHLKKLNCWNSEVIRKSEIDQPVSLTYRSSLKHLSVCILG